MSTEDRTDENTKDSQQFQSPPPPRRRRQPGAMAGSGSSLHEALYGLAGGVVFGFVSPIVGHPFDTVKTRMQADAAYHNTGLRQTVRQIYRSEGIVRGFYRGFLPPLLGSMAFRGLLFSAYSGTYAACEKVPVLGDPIPMTGGLRPSVLMGALSAALVRSVIESPLDFIKVRYMVAEQVGHAHVLQDRGTESLRSSLRHPLQTVRHLYHGFTPTFLRTLGLLGSFFVMVDYSVRYIPNIINAPGVGPFFKGGVCATTAWVFAFPFESAKSVIQADTTGKYKTMSNATWHVLKELYRERGIVHGLYRGFGPGAGRSFVANGISMFVFSKFQEMIRQEEK